jgi:sulfite reductase subunit B
MAELTAVQQLTEREKLFTFRLGKGQALGQQPGQFVEVSLFGIGEAPISVSSSPTRNGTFQLCVRSTGDVTNAMHKMSAGEWVGIRGPFGHGFPVEKMRGKDILFAAGGIGLAPLRSLIHFVLDERESFGRVVILFGCRNPSEILFTKELEEWGQRKDVEFHMTVDRAGPEWKGHVGVITTLFPGVAVNPRSTVAVTCGPPIMYRFVLIEMLAKGIPENQIYLSLERRMKCGVGKCGHCQINGVYCCQEGPVFTYAQTKGLKEAI